MLIVLKGKIYLEEPLEIIRHIVTLFGYDDVPITQEIVDKHFYRVDIDNELRDEHKTLYDKVLEYAETKYENMFIIPQIQTGERVYIADNPIILPKFFIGVLYD